MIFTNVVTAEPKLINITEQAEEWFASGQRELDFASLDATPCFPCIWFEWLPKTFRHGVLAIRHSVTPGLSVEILANREMQPPVDGAKYFIQMLFFSEFHAWPQFHGLLEFYVNSMGNPIGELQIVCRPKDNGILSNFGLLCADTLTTINTAGTRVEPPFNSPHAQMIKPDRKPCSVWHTVVIPKFRNPPLVGAVVSPEMLERREHWVRGHRKDYRHGNGMFGRVKALVWVPEFQRGNPELGSVHQTYEVRK